MHVKPSRAGPTERRPRTVEEQVDTAQSGDRLGDDARAVSRCAHVAGDGHRQRRAVDELRQPLGPATDDGDRGTASDGPAGEGAADAG